MQKIILAGLDWQVMQAPIYTGAGEIINGYKANIRNTDRQVLGVVTDRYKIIQKIEKNATTVQIRNICKLREDMNRRYYEAPDLRGIGSNAYRFLNAVSDFATHSEPLRRTANYKENLFMRTIDGNPMIDKAYQLLCTA